MSGPVTFVVTTHFAECSDCGWTSPDDFEDEAAAQQAADEHLCQEAS